MVHVIEEETRDGDEDLRELTDEKGYVSRRNLQLEEPPGREECFECFKSQQRYCLDPKLGHGQCCDPAEGSCANEEMPMFCSSDEGISESNIGKADDRLYRSVCPEHDACH